MGHFEPNMGQNMGFMGNMGNICSVGSLQPIYYLHIVPQRMTYIIKTCEFAQTGKVASYPFHKSIHHQSFIL